MKNLNAEMAIIFKYKFKNNSKFDFTSHVSPKEVNINTCVQTDHLSQLYSFLDISLTYCGESDFDLEDLSDWWILKEYEKTISI
jgi:hypothetical protein